MSMPNPTPTTPEGWFIQVFAELRALRVDIAPLIEGAKGLDQRVDLLEKWVDMRKVVIEQEEQRDSQRARDLAMIAAFTSAVGGILGGLIAAITGLSHLFGH